MSWLSRPATRIAVLAALAVAAVVLVGPHAAAADEGTTPVPPKPSAGVPLNLGGTQIGPVQVGPIDVGGTVDALAGGVTGTGGIESGHHGSGTGQQNGAGGPSAGRGTDPTGPATSNPGRSPVRHRPDQSATSHAHRSAPRQSTGTRQQHARERNAHAEGRATTGTGQQATTRKVRTVYATGRTAGTDARVLDDPPGSQRVLHRANKLAGDALGPPLQVGATIPIVLGATIVLAIGVLVLLVSTGRRPRRT